MIKYDKVWNIEIFKICTIIHLAGRGMNTRKLTEQEFKAFCNLLNDEEGRTLHKLTSEFKSLIEQEPAWKDWLSTQEFITANHRATQILEEMRWEELGKSLKALLEKEGKNFNLEEALCLLASFPNGLFKREEITEPLNRMARDLTPAIREAQDVDMLAKIFRQYLFKIQGFHGNMSNYYDPDNTYVNKVLDRKIGIPISLSCVAMLLADRLIWRDRPVPLFGIGLPSHFIVQFRFPEKQAYLDPFNRGRILSRRDCIELLRSQDIGFQESYLEPVNNLTILSRSISNLVYVYNDLGNEKLRDQLLKYLQILQGE